MVLELVRKLGALCRETREVKEAVETEKAEDREKKAKQLATDLKALQTENKARAIKYSSLTN